MRFDSGPEVFVRVNRNYVLTEYVLNENDCIDTKWSADRAASVSAYVGLISALQTLE